MAKDYSILPTKRIEIPYFEGVNANIGANVSKKTELAHSENARSLVIGTIEKRKGTRRLGNAITATANYGLMYFKNDNTLSNFFHRISTVSAATSIYYINTSAVWTALTGIGTNILELGASTTQFDITNTSGSTYRYTYDTTGQEPDIDAHMRVGSTIIIAAQNFASVNNGTFVVTGVSTNYFEVTNSSGSAENNKTIGTGSITVVISTFSHVIVDDRCFLVNGNNDNMNIESDGTSIVSSADIGSSTTQFDITLTGGTTYRYTYDTTGTDPEISKHVFVGQTIFVYSPNFSAGNNNIFTVTGVGTDYFEVTNASGVAEGNKTIGTGSIHISGCLKNSPKAHKINYYKDRLYLADYIQGDVRYKNGIMISSAPLGIVSLVDGDATLPVTTLTVTDAKYIQVPDFLDVYRGNSKVGRLTVTAKSGYDITCTITYEAGMASVLSADELWVAGTYNGEKVYRWVDNASSGVNIKQYDTFRLSGGDNDEIKMFTNINDFMVMANNNNLGTWNNSAVKNYSTRIGCVSSRGYVEAFNRLYFIGYKGIYEFDGSNFPTLISSKVDPYILGATKAGLEAATAGKQGFSIFFHIGSSTLYHPDGSVDKTITNTTLEYDLRKKNWYPQTDLKVTEFQTYPKTSNSDLLEFSSTETGYHIFEMFNGQLDDRVTDDKEIPFRIDTDNLTLGQRFEQICYPMEIYVESERGSGIACFVSLDNEQFYELEGSAIKGCSKFKITNRDVNMTSPPRCRQIKLSLRDNTKKLCRISRVALIYAESMETEENKEVTYE